MKPQKTDEARATLRMPKELWMAVQIAAIKRDETAAEFVIRALRVALRTKGGR